MRKKRREEKPHVRLKAVKRVQDGICNQGTKQHAVISTKNTRLNPESSIAFASPHEPVQQSYELQYEIRNTICTTHTSVDNLCKKRANHANNKLVLRNKKRK